MEKLGVSIMVAVQGSALWYLYSLALLDAEPALDVPAALVSLGDLPFIRLSWVDLTEACNPVARKQDNWLSSRY